MRQLIIGQGEIGKAVALIFPEAQVRDIVSNDMSSYDVLHICFPYSENFVDMVRGYIGQYKADRIVIWSTLPIGTTSQIQGAVHSPVEGKHPDLEMSIRFMERWVGYNDEDSKFFFVNLFKDAGLRTKLIPSSDFTEALKLLSTTEYGINIEFARYKKQIAKSLDMPYKLVKEFNEEYNKLYQNLGMGKRYQKYVLDAPTGPKGGHCVTPNAKLLHEQYPSEFTKIVGEL